MPLDCICTTSSENVCMCCEILYGAIVIVYEYKIIKWKVQTLLFYMRYENQAKYIVISLQIVCITKLVK